MAARFSMPGAMLGNAPGGTIGVTMSPSPVILMKDFNNLGADIRSYREPLRRSIKEVLGPSFQKNFAVGGRPRWRKLSAVTLSIKAREGYSSRILIRKGTLSKVAAQYNIWTIQTDRAFVSKLPERAWYGVMHQMGGFAGVVNEIPARPFLIIQPEDVDKIDKVFTRWIQDRAVRHGFRRGADV